jgi:hypothetical protein
MNDYEKKQNIDKAYVKIESEILSTLQYKRFISYLLQLQEFKDSFTINNEFDANLAKKATESLDVLRYLCNDETGIGKEKDFHDFILKAIEELPYGPAQKVVYTYMLETKYGNPKRSDYTLNDMLFYILQSVYGMDFLILTCTNNKVSVERFFDVLKTEEPNLLSDFFGQFYELRQTLYNEEDRDVIKQKFEEKKDFFMPYIVAGISNQYDEESRNKNANFPEIDNLVSILTGELGYKVFEKNVK